MPGSRCRKGQEDQTVRIPERELQEEMKRSTTLPDPETGHAVDGSETRRHPRAGSVMGTRRSHGPRPGLAEPYVDVRPPTPPTGARPEPPSTAPSPDPNRGPTTPLDCGLPARHSGLSATRTPSNRQTLGTPETPQSAQA